MNGEVKIINPFTNVVSTPLPSETETGEYFARAIQVGSGQKMLRVDASGMWLGAENFASAPFSVDMDGNLIASSVTLSGYLAVGDAANDVNTHGTTISGTKLTTGTVTADYVVAGISMSAPTITGGTIQTASSGKRVVISSNKIEIFNSSGVSVGTFEGLTGTYASAIQTSIAEINVLAMDAEAIGFTSITKDALIGVDLGDLRLTTMKSDTSGGDIVLSPETGQSVVSYRNIIPNVDGSLYLGNSTYGWGRLYLGSSSRYLYDNAGTLYWNGAPVGGGEVNTASNKGGTYGWYSNKSTYDLQFKGLSVSSRLSVTSYTDYLYLDHATGSGYNHIPSGGTTYYTMYNSGAGVASWSRAVYVGSSGYYFDYNAGGIVCSQNLMPATDGSQYLGNSSYGWGRVYVGTLGAYFSVSGAFLSASVGMAIGGNTSVSGQLSVVGEVYASAGSFHTSGNVYTGGYGANEGSVNCAFISGDAGGIDLDTVGSLQVSTHLDPSSAGSYNLGGATRYWNDVSYKTLTDRGCLGWFDDGVEMQDGRILSDLEAIKAVQKHPTKKTIYGVPMLDYTTMPKCVYKPATSNDGEILPRDENDDPYQEIIEDIYKTDKDGKKVLQYKKGDKIPAQDGAETTALISIMFGAIKELTAKVEALENK